MTRSLTKQKALAYFIAERRRASGITQVELAKKLGRYQSFVAHLESGQRRIDVVELAELAEAIGFDPVDAFKAVSTVT